MKRVPLEAIESIKKKKKVPLKAELVTPVGGGVSSINVRLMKELDLFDFLVHFFNLPRLPRQHENVDIVVPGVVERLKVITKFCPEYIAQYAFEYAYLNNRKKVTVVQKANIMNLADGLFLESCREVATKYPSIKYNEIIVDNCCTQLVSKPEQSDVMVTPNLYGNLMTNTTAGISEGTGVMPGGDLTSEDKLFDLFESWMSKHGKTYKSVEEKIHRFQVFKDNFKYINESNKVESSFSLGLNQFADLSLEEMLDVC